MFSLLMAVCIISRYTTDRVLLSRQREHHTLLPSPKGREIRYFCETSQQPATGRAHIYLNGDNLCHVVEAGDGQGHRRLPLHLRRSPVHQQADQVFHQRRLESSLQTFPVLGHVAKNLNTDNICLLYTYIYAGHASAAVARLLDWSGGPARREEDHPNLIILLSFPGNIAGPWFSQGELEQDKPIREKKKKATLRQGHTPDRARYRWSSKKVPTGLRQN